ncbi:substrate-binding periplasmic protein [Devosia naphthalenivorans]|uniref:substrate-binding periplasmic protein n=1 Tax=Devosia naphthalenivorans TaxID=2082392 RepID=UPI000D33910D|nr:transporter substrate-binding domain-containing protein [Devosia naphthalenivorans]
MSGDLLTFAMVFGLMGAVYLLPSDTSLAEVQRTGNLKVCIPPSYPPLVTADPAEPGYDVSLLQELARRMDLRLSLTQNPQMGRDFNPRNWRVTRAQCEILAGGVITSLTTQSFLETISTEVATGWAVVLKPGASLQPDMQVGVLPGLGGLDRLGLSSYLRANGAQGVLRPTLDALEAGLVEDEFKVVVTEALGAGQLILRHPDWQIAWLTNSLDRFNLGLGLWKGDLTLKRAVVDALSSMEGDGTLDALRQRYGIVPIDAVADFSS